MILRVLLEEWGGESPVTFKTAFTYHPEPHFLFNF